METNHIGKFKLDMKVMYRDIGIIILLRYLKIQLMIWVISLNVFFLLDFSIYESIGLAILPVLGFSIHYVALYLTKYRPLFREFDKELEMREKYRFMYDRFINTDK